MILVLGGTGQVGQLLVRQLKEKGVSFRALAHSTASKEKLEAQGIETIVGDYTQPESLGPLFTGIERVFLLTPSSPFQTELERTIVDHAKAAGVTQIVKLSVLFADREPDLQLLRWHTQSEEYLKTSGLQYTILRPNAMMQNFARIDSATIAAQNALYATVGESRISVIDATDLAEVAVRALTSDQQRNSIYELTGPEALSYPEIAEKFTKLLGRPIHYVDLPDEAWRGGMVSAGVPEWYADGLIGLYDFYRQGKGALVTDTLAQLIDHPPTTLDSYLQANKALFT